MISFFSNIESQIAGDRSVVAVDSVQAVVMVVGIVVMFCWRLLGLWWRLGYDGGGKGGVS